MTQGMRGVEVSESYLPSGAVINYLEEELRNFKKTEIEKEKIAAGDREGWTKDEIRKRKNLDKRKVDVLNHFIFPAMANLTVFLEYIGKHEELQHIFDKNIKELLLGRYVREDKGSNEPDSDKPSENSDIPVFQRFIMVATTVDWREKENANNFRLALISMLAHVLYQKLIAIIPPLLKQREIAGTEPILLDLYRIIWEMRLMTRNVEIDIEEPDRPVLF